MTGRLSAKFLFIIVSFHSYANKTNFHMKSFAFSLAFVMRFIAIQKWPIFFSFYFILKLIFFLTEQCIFYLLIYSIIRQTGTLLMYYLME